MIHATTEQSVEFCGLVEHPGGRDGGDFPKYDKLSIEDRDGLRVVVYDAGTPSCSNDSFADEDDSDFVELTTKESAASFVRQELEKTNAAAKALENLLAVLEEPNTSYEVLLDGEEYDPEDEDDEDEDD